MSELKALKSALITSIVSVVLCLAMLLGGTFAYFSSDVTGNVATIQTGYLSFNAMYDDTSSLSDVAGAGQVMYTSGAQLSFVSLTDSTQTLWTPGGKYALPAIYFSNLGNINCTVSYVLTFTDVDVDLMDVIDFTVNVDGITCTMPKPDNADNVSVFTSSDNTNTVNVELDVTENTSENGKPTYTYTITYNKEIAGQANSNATAYDVRMQMIGIMNDVTNIDYMNRTLASSINLTIKANQASSQAQGSDS